MFGPDSTRHELVGLMQHERLSHAALLQKVARERTPDASPIDHQAQRRITVRRLAASFAGAVRSASVATVSR